VTGPRRVALPLVASVVGALLAASGTFAFLGASYATYSDTGTLPLVSVRVTAQFPVTTTAPTEPSAPAHHHLDTTGAPDPSRPARAAATSRAPVVEPTTTTRSAPTTPPSPPPVPVTTTVSSTPDSGQP
jgi:hypothetical protein